MSKKNDSPKTLTAIFEEAVSQLEMENNLLKPEDYKDMAGKPVWCPELGDYGIIKYEIIGKWTDVPFLVGVHHEYGAAVNFEYNIEDRGLKCYRLNNQ